MRHVTERGDCPSHLLRPQIEDKLAEVFDRDIINTKAIESKVYRGLAGPVGSTFSLTEQELAKRYFGKCAYCESYDEIEIEHYRPKGAVKGIKGHPGYYWLCYEWTNLLPSCHSCNEIIRGKGTQFPIQNEVNRRSAPLLDGLGNLDWNANAIDSPYLSVEEPLLLHPEHDEPEKYLGFAIDPATQRVTINGTDELNRGEATIKICNLKRSSLLTNRTKDVILHARVLIEKLLLFAELQLTLELTDDALKIAFRQLDKEAQDDTLTYTLLRKYVVSTPLRFKLLVADRLGEASHRLLVAKVFEIYRSENPIADIFA